MSSTSALPASELPGGAARNHRAHGSGAPCVYCGHHFALRVQADPRARPAADLVRELTVTNFVFRRSGEDGLLLTGMIWHARLGGWLPPCGHVEPGETPGCGVDS